MIGKAGSPKHDVSDARVYRAWRAMIQRCTNPNHQSFFRYGGRGISVCARWAVFDNFLSDMGKPPEGYSIERINNDAGYSPKNCCWIPRGEQARNRRTTVLVEIEGKKVCAFEAARRAGISGNLLHWRMKHGATGKALFLPARKQQQIITGPDGVALTQNEWSVRLGIPACTFSMRRKRGWPSERILEPVR